MMNATDPISITLQAAEWNVVIAALVEQPYRISAPLVQKIGEQARLQEQATILTQRPNGEADAHAPD